MNLRVASLAVEQAITDEIFATTCSCRGARPHARATHVGHEAATDHVPADRSLQDNDLLPIGHAPARHGSPPVIHAGRDSGIPETNRAATVLRSNFDRVALRTHAIEALTTAGFPRPTSRALVEAVLATSPADLTIEQLLRESLRLSRVK